MRIAVIILFLLSSVVDVYSQGVPRFLWNPVVKPYEFVPNPDSNNSRQRGFDSSSNKQEAHTLGTPILSY